MATIDGKKYARGVHEIDGHLICVIDDHSAVCVGKASASIPEPVKDFAPKPPKDDRINVNECSVDDLVAIDGISETIAERIVDSRPFEDIADLTRVKGIGSRFIIMHGERLKV